MSAYTALEEMGDRTYHASQALLVGEALAAQGRVDEAEEWLAVGKHDDADGVALEGLIAARRGRLGEAEELTRASLALGGEMPVPLTVDARFTLAEILLSAGRIVEAETEAEACLLRYDAKGIVPLIENAHSLLADIRAAERTRST